MPKRPKNMGEILAMEERGEPLPADIQKRLKESSRALEDALRSTNPEGRLDMGGWGLGEALRRINPEGMSASEIRTWGKFSRSDKETPLADAIRQARIELVAKQREHSDRPSKSKIRKSRTLTRENLLDAEKQCRTRAEEAKFLGVSKRTVQRYREHYKLK